MVSGECSKYLPKLVSAFSGDFILIQAGLLGCNEHGAFSLLNADKARMVCEAAWSFLLKIGGAELLWLRRFDSVPPF